MTSHNYNKVILLLDQAPVKELLNEAFSEKGCDVVSVSTIDSAIHTLNSFENSLLISYHSEVKFDQTSLEQIKSCLLINGGKAVLALDNKELNAVADVAVPLNIVLINKGIRPKLLTLLSLAVLENEELTIRSANKKVG
jgi:hypothetical protein